MEELISLYRKGEYNEVLSAARGEAQEDLEVKLLAGLALCEAEEPNKAFEFLYAELEDFTEFSLPTVSTLMKLSYRAGNYNKVEGLIDTYHSLSDPQASLFWREIGSTSIGMLYHIKGSYDKALEYYSRSRELNEGAGENNGIAESLINLGEVHMDMGDSEAAEELFSESLRLSKIGGNRINIAYNHYNLGRIYKITGRYSTAELALHQASQQFKEAGRLTGYVVCINQLGNILTLRGRLKEAKVQFEVSLDICRELESPFYTAMVHQQLGIVELKLGNLDNGLYQMGLALAIWRKLGNDIEQVSTMYDLVSVLVGSDNKLEEAESYVRELSKLKSDSLPERSIAKIDFSRALVYNTRNRLQDKVRAQEIFEDLLSTRTSSADFRSSVLLQLIDIKIFEMRTFDDDTILDEIEEYLEQLWQIAIDEGLNPLKIEILFLKTKIFIIGNRFEKANSVLHEAKNIDGFSRVPTNKARYESMTAEINSAIAQWNRVSDKVKPLREKFDESNISDYLDDVAKALNDL